MDQPPQDSTGGAENIDINKILLPTKDAISTDSAQRAPAGELLQQEQSAKLEVPPAPRNAVSPPPSSQQERSGVQPLQTYQGDIADAVQQNNVSVVSIAAQEAVRRGEQPLQSDSLAPRSSHALRTTLLSTASIALIVAAGGLVSYALLRNAPLAPQAAPAPALLQVDDTRTVELRAGAGRAETMNALVNAKNSTSIALGLFERLVVEQEATSGPSTALTAPALLSLLSISIPQSLLRDIEPSFVLGVHSFGENQPFLVLQVDSYEQAYAGMLAWEVSMKSDLSPLFDYAPPPSGAPVQQADASSTPPAQFTPSLFTDKVVANHDARVLETADGSVYFLWTFLDRNTVAITTNEGTLREIASRLSRAPVTSLPQQ